MKKKYISAFLATFLMSGLVFAQNPANRTAKTIVADVLAQMPTKNNVNFEAQMGALASKAGETTTLLLGMMKTPASKGNNSVEYALAGLSDFVSKHGNEQARMAVSKAYIAGLENTTDREIKAFIIRNLQIVGLDEAVETLKNYATTKDFQNEAVSALVAIGSAEAKTALHTIASKIPDKAVAAKAVGDLGLTTKEGLLISWINTGNADLQKTIFDALADIGSEKSLKILRDEAAEVSYNYEANNAVTAYLDILERLAKITPTKYSKELIGLLKNKNENVKTFATTSLGEMGNPVVVPNAMKALKSDSRNYRNVAIKTACGVVGEDFFKNVKFDFDKLSEETQIDVVNICADNRYSVLVGEIEDELNSTNKELQTASFRALAKIATNKAIGDIADVFEDEDADMLAYAEEVLRWANSDVVIKEVYDEFEDASEMGKVAIINVLAYRGATDLASDLMALTSDTSTAVSEAAYKAISTLSTKKQLPELYAMLEKADNSKVGYIQKAIGGALTEISDEDAYANVEKQFLAAPSAKKHLYYAILSYTNTPAAFKTIVEGVSSSNKDVQSAAVASLLEWKDKIAIQPVYEVIANDDLASYHDKAIQSYISLVNNAGFNDQQKYLYIRKALETARTAEEQNKLLQQLTPLNSFGALMTAGDYLSNTATRAAAGTVVLNVAQKDKNYDNWSKDVEDVLKQFIATREGGDAGYEKTAIQQYLDKAPKETGFVKIFNEKDLSGWKGLVGNPISRAKMTEKQLASEQIKADEIMKTGWEVRDGILYFTGKGNNLCTDKKYGDFEMYVDWCIEKEGDAGIYLRGTPQVQIWDTSRVEVGAQVGSGALYNNIKNPSKPLELADGRIGDWNTLYIKMVGERVTVLLNGVKVVDNVILENYWDRSIPIFLEEQLELQAHGTLVGYRDIYVKELPKVEPIKLSEQEQKEGYKLLFDGVSMNNWTGNTKDYVAENGTITLYPGNGGGGNLYTEKEYKDFVFKFDFMLTDAANNGLGIRTPMEGDAAYVGMELQILDNEHQVYSQLKKYQYHGSIYGVIPSKRGYLKPTGEWNSQEVYVKGSHIKVTLNGEVIMDGDIAEASKNGTMDGIDHPGLKNEKGHIGFLGHGSEVKFKNIRVKEL